MSRRVDEGFSQAESDNLPKIDVVMVAEYFKNNECFTASEIRGVKAASAGRESYGDAAVGYVQLKRNAYTCIVKCKICPEHRVRSKNYEVFLEVNEAQNKVIKVQCQDCAASEGGCKHAVAFLMWVHRRSEEPAPTEVKCYWKKSQLSKIGTSVKFITVQAFGGSPVEQPQNSFFEETKNLGLQQNAEGLIFKMFCEPKYSCLNLQMLLLKFAEQNGNNYEDFSNFAKQHMNDDLCQQAAISTMMQAEDSLWHQLRFGRITASKLYASAHCRTEYGSLVQQILGVTKLRDTEAMERGRKLEKNVLDTLEKSLDRKFSSTGIVLCKQHPIFGASPDAVFNNHVVEVKCPSTARTVSNYLTTDNKITARYRAQVQLQMHILNKPVCIFSVADPNFEKNQKLTSISIAYDKAYIGKLMFDAENFWKQYVFPILLESAKK